jgi:hypothetical protein
MQLHTGPAAGAGAEAAEVENSISVTGREHAAGSTASPPSMQGPARALGRAAPHGEDSPPAESAAAPAMASANAPAVGSVPRPRRQHRRDVLAPKSHLQSNHHAESARRAQRSKE